MYYMSAGHEKKKQYRTDRQAIEFPWNAMAKKTTSKWNGQKDNKYIQTIADDNKNDNFACG